jgi:hypothetical protein
LFVSSCQRAAAVFSGEIPPADTTEKILQSFIDYLLSDGGTPERKVWSVPSEHVIEHKALFLTSQNVYLITGPKIPPKIASTLTHSHKVEQLAPPLRRFTFGSGWAIASAFNNIEIDPKDLIKIVSELDGLVSPEATVIFNHELLPIVNVVPIAQEVV